MASRFLSAARGSTVVWDFDGVLADSEPLQAETYRRLLESWGNDTAAFGFMAYVGRTEREIWALIASDGYRLGLPVEGRMSERDTLFRELALDRLGPSWVARELGGLAASAGCWQVVVSNGVPEVIDALLDRWELPFFLERLDTRGHPEGKRGVLEGLWSAGPTVTVEDDAGWLRRAGEAGSWRLAVRHSLNAGAVLEAELEVPIGGPR